MSNASALHRSMGLLCMVDAAEAKAIETAAADGAVAALANPTPAVGPPPSSALHSAAPAASCRPPQPWDWSELIILVLGVVSVGLGAGWGSLPEREALRRAEADAGGGSVQCGEEGGAAPPLQERAPFTRATALVFLATASTFLVLLFFFRSQLYYVLVAVFVLVGAAALHGSAEVLTRSSPRWRPTAAVPLLGVVSPTSAAVAVGCLGLGVLWAVERDAAYAWVLQDVLGIAFMAQCLGSIELRSLKTATIALVLFLLYDVFFVFVTPYISGGSSVMVQAATGDATFSPNTGCYAYKQMLPFLIRVPRLVTPPCDCASDSMLGFGDVVFPGLLVTLGARFDCVRAARSAVRGSGTHGWRHLPYTFALLAVGAPRRRTCQQRPPDAPHRPTPLASRWPLPPWSSCRWRSPRCSTSFRAPWARRGASGGGAASCASCLMGLGPRRRRRGALQPPIVRVRSHCLQVPNKTTMRAGEGGDGGAGGGEGRPVSSLETLGVLDDLLSSKKVRPAASPP